MYGSSDTSIVKRQICYLRQVITLTVITACFSEYKYSEALYSLGSDVSARWLSRSTQRRRKTVLIQFPQSID